MIDFSINILWSWIGLHFAMWRNLPFFSPSLESSFFLFSFLFFMLFFFFRLLSTSLFISRNCRVWNFLNLPTVIIFCKFFSSPHMFFQLYFYQFLLYISFNLSCSIYTHFQSLILSNLCFVFCFITWMFPCFYYRG